MPIRTVDESRLRGMSLNRQMSRILLGAILPVVSCFAGPGIATTTTVSVSPGTIATTASAALTATVTASSGGITPTGTVSFDLGSKTLGDRKSTRLNSSHL